MKPKMLFFCSKTALFTIIKIIMVNSLTCDEILETPEGKEWTLAELQSIKPMDVVECLAHLTKEKLLAPEAQYIWDAVIKHYEGIPNVPEEKLSILHWASIAVKPEDFANMTLDNIEVIENFGLHYNLNPAQLSAIANKVREDWGGKEPEDYSYYDLIALRQILCAFNRSEIERINPPAYKEASAIIGKLKDCDTEVLQGFATLASQKSAFGSPSKWNDGTLEILGVVAEHLPKGIKEKINRRKNKNNLKTGQMRDGPTP